MCRRALRYRFSAQQPNVIADQFAQNVRVFANLRPLVGMWIRRAALSSPRPFYAFGKTRFDSDWQHVSFVHFAASDVFGEPTRPRRRDADEFCAVTIVLGRTTGVVVRDAGPLVATIEFEVLAQPPRSKLVRMTVKSRVTLPASLPSLPRASLPRGRADEGVFARHTCCAIWDFSTRRTELSIREGILGAERLRQAT